MSRRSVARVCYALFFVSGLSSLLYEVVWSKLLNLLFGSTVFAVSTVTAALFAGLALGSYWFGRIVDRRKDALRIYAGLEVLIALVAVVLPSMLEALQPIVDAVHRATHGTFYTLSLVRFALVFLVLVVPTTLMGGTLPVLAKFFTAQAGSVGKEVGKLYSLNTVGAVIGTLVAGFVLIGRIGVRKTTWVAIALNLLVGAVGLALSKATTQETEEKKPGEEKPADDAVPNRRVILAAFALSGFASLAYEILAIRSLLLVLPYGYNSIYVFTTVLVVFLGGIALGSAIATRVVDRVKRPLAALTWLEIGLALYVAATPHVLNVVVIPAGFFPDTIGPGRFVDAFLKATLALLVPTVLMGATFPLAARMYGRSKASLGADIGRLYAINTVGSIFGSFVAGFVLIPTLGVNRGYLLAAVFNLAAGLVVYPSWAPDPARARKVGIAAIALSLVVIVLRPIPVPTYVGNDKVIYYNEGTASTIQVREDAKGARAVQTNEFVAASTDYFFLRNQRMMGDLPLLLHEDPKKILVICFGTGTTIGALLQYDKLEALTSVEIDAGIFAAARFFAEKNHDALDDPRVTRIVDDGRNFVRYTDERFDIITSEPLHPKRAGTVNLYSEDYYRLAKSRLAKGGILAQWLPLHAFQPDEFKSVARAFRNVFPHSYLWLGQQMILIGTEERISIDFQSFASRMAQPAIAKDLAEIDFVSPYDVLTGFMLNEKEIDPWLGGSPTITDDLPTIEYSTDQRHSNLYPEWLEKRGDVLPYVVKGPEWDDAKYQAYLRRFDRLLAAKGAYLAGDAAKADAAVREAEQAVPDDRYLAYLRSQCGGGRCALGDGSTHAVELP